MCHIVKRTEIKYCYVTGAYMSLTVDRLLFGFFIVCANFSFGNGMMHIFLVNPRLCVKNEASV